MTPAERNFMIQLGVTITVLVKQASDNASSLEDVQEIERELTEIRRRHQELMADDKERGNA